MPSALAAKSGNPTPIVATNIAAPAMEAVM
jgi:hypothetical protein